ncbi:MAG: hypothetical protein AAB856_01700, partial [Patescibacteria group bacterium]
LLLRQESAITQDLGRHLRLGEMIVAGDSRKCALYSNCLTYTYPDYPFINHHWGSEVIFYLIHKWSGFSGIIVFKAVVLGLAFAITLLHSLELNKGQAFLKRPGLLWLAVTITLVFLSVQMMADRLTTRPEIFGYLLFSLLFLLLNSSFQKRHFSLFLASCSLLIALWVNLHISFIFGLILIYLWSFSTLIKKGPALRRKAGPYQTIDAPSIPTILAIPTISTIITLLNPSGLRGALMPLSILKDYGYTIVENMTPFFLTAFKPQPEYWIYGTLLITTIALFLFSSAKKDPFHLLTFLTFSLFPLIAVRHLPFFALMVVPVLTPLIAVKFRPAERGPASQDKLPIIASGCLLIAALTNPIPLAYGKLSPIGLAIDSRHNSAVEFVKQNNPKGKMWNNYDIGSFLEWAIPEHKTFVDGRPEAFPVGFFQKTYIPMQENKEVWDRVATDYDIQWIFAALTDSTPWFIKWWKMIQSHQDWRIVYIDNYSAVLVRINGNNNLIEPQGRAKLLKISD